MEEFSGDVCQVSSTEESQRFNDSHSAGAASEEGGEETIDDTNDQTTQSNGDEAAAADDDVVRSDVLAWVFHASECWHHVVEHHSDTIIQQRLSEHEEVEVRVDTNLGEDGENSNLENDEHWLNFYNWNIFTGSTAEMRLA